MVEEASERLTAGERETSSRGDDDATKASTVSRSSGASKDSGLMQEVPPIHENLEEVSSDAQALSPSFSPLARASLLIPHDTTQLAHHKGSESGISFSDEDLSLFEIKRRVKGKAQSDIIRGARGRVG
ncbi:unnamed protein product [Linum trigynum]|uniref:Uncharacterized protein n=1 Tax=Linum trigynum TaxID=586398 RepID=A0AAV2E5W3_9ROSI